MRIALVHEWLESFAGAEQVLEQMLEAYPRADVFSIVDFMPEQQRGFLGDRKVRTSFIQKLPFAKRKFRAYLPLMPIAIEQFDFSDFDVVITGNHAVSKGILTKEDQVHLSYVHTPVRYAWDLYQSALTNHGLTRGPKSWLTRGILHYLRLWDHVSAARVDGYAANSHYVARRIWKTYRRKARVIYPPVNVDRFEVQQRKDSFYVTVSRLVPYKRVNLLVEAFRRMPDRKLVVIGDGPEFQKLSQDLPANVSLMGRQPEKVVTEHLQSARAFLFAANEDFGISPVEAQACGTPVIAYGHGGATETVIHGHTGLHFAEQTAESVVAAVEAFEGQSWNFDPFAIRAHADRFSPERFQSELAAFVDRHWAKRNERQGLTRRQNAKPPRFLSRQRKASSAAVKRVIADEQ